MKDSYGGDSLSALLGPGRNLHILIVEDNDELRQRLTETLTAMGHRVDARPGVERTDLPLTGYDVAFLDNYFTSETLTGVSLTPELRRSCPQARLIAMSSDRGRNAEMLRFGANFAVDKRAMRRMA